MHLKKFLKIWLNYSYFSVFNGILTAVNAILLARAFSSEVFGLIALVNASSMLLTKVLPFNALGYIPILYSSDDNKNNELKKRIYFSITGIITLLLSPVIAILSHIYFQDWALGILILGFCITVCLNDFDNAFSIQHYKSSRYGTAIFLSRFTFLALLLMTEWLENKNLYFYLAIGILAELSSAVYRKNLSDLIYLFKYRYGLLKSPERDLIIGYGLKYFPLTIVAWAFMFADRFVMSDRLSLTEVARYSVAFTIASTVGLLFTSVSNTFFPKIYRAKLEDFRSYFFYIKLQSILLFFGSLLATLLFMSSPYLLRLLGKEEYLDLSMLILILSFAMTFLGINKISSGYLDANILYISKTFLFSSVSLGALLSNIYLIQTQSVIKISIVFLISNILISLGSNIAILKFIRQNNFKSKRR